ncbi:DUF2637 domain-containing protein [Streptomyces sp. HPF1205]|uniref:DUF2637 domain-containing protein n=1 Tax=Streptomyces sp. HPF1205 TaxID=2873262 RepID=UPI001CEC5544|nr:DUF2637 domain-containing protein [Streptomyces sp. HPF1205]
MTPKSAREFLTIAASGVIVALTAAAFWLSYAHLRSVAATYGLSASPARAWAWPATLDLFIVAGELLLLRASLTGRTDWWAIGLTVTGSGGSIALNISGVGAHAHTLDYVVAAVPPTAALLAFGALMRQVHDALAAPDVRTTTETTAPDTPAATAADPVAVTARDDAPAPGQPATAPPAATATPPRPAARTTQAPSRVRQAPGAGKTSRPVRTDDELLAHLRELRTGASAPLSQRQVLAALGIGVPRLRALLDAHGLTLDPLPAPARPLALVTTDDQQQADDSAAAL